MFAETYKLFRCGNWLKQMLPLITLKSYLLLYFLMSVMMIMTVSFQPCGSSVAILPSGNNCEKWFTVSSFSNNFMDMHFILGNCTNPQPLRLWMYVLQLCLYQLLWFRLPDYITFCFFAFWRAFAFISEPKCCHVQFGIFLSKFDRMIGWCLKMYL